jgi:site-specific recombinase XerD
MAFRTKLVRAEALVRASGCGSPGRIYARADLAELFSKARLEGLLAKHTKLEEFINFLVQRRHLLSITLQSKRYGKRITRYCVGRPSRLLTQPDEKLPSLGPRDIRNIRRGDMRTHFNALRNNGYTVSQVNKTIKTAKAIFTYAFDSEYVATNIMQRYPKLQRGDDERKANRGVFTEAELQAIFATATPFEFGLFGTLSIAGPAPR